MAVVALARMRCGWPFGGMTLVGGAVHLREV
jgi:hypothetical protein